MHIDLIQSLRCIAPHEDSWLVAGIERMAGRHVVEGLLGCPMCRAEYPVQDAIAYFGADPADRPRAQGVAASDEEIVRIAALLGLTESGRTIVLGGRWARAAPQLVELTPVHVLAVNPDVALGEDERISVVHARGALPLLPGSMDGIALDEPSDQSLGSVSAAHALRSGGRLVLPASVLLPPGVRELARDDRDSVSERETAPTPIALRRS
jgi:hypothetical protein